MRRERNRTLRLWTASTNYLNINFVNSKVQSICKLVNHTITPWFYSYWHRYLRQNRCLSEEHRASRNIPSPVKNNFTNILPKITPFKFNGNTTKLVYNLQHQFSIFQLYFEPCYLDHPGFWEIIHIYSESWSFGAIIVTANIIELFHFTGGLLTFDT